MIENTGFYSKKKGTLAKGCQQCVRGSKMVLFVTGICPRNCFYCPVSDDRMQKDVIKADEWVVEKDSDIIEECEAISAEGCGITGGDPLSKLDRTIHYIKLLKEKFGSDFHIHLYTSLDLVTEDKLKELYDAGLDEIRFHLDLESDELWSRIDLAKKFDWDVGVEIPLVPNLRNETFKMVEFLNRKIDFLNLNELEISDSNSCELVDRGYKSKDGISYGVKGSVELGMEIMDKFEGNVHLCTCKLKDKVQLGNRIKRRAKNVALSTDRVQDGILTRGVVYFKMPGFGYHEKISEIEVNMDKFSKLEKLGPVTYDSEKKRVLTSVGFVKKNKKKIKKMGLIPAIVQEYPTKDAIELEIDFL